MLTHRDGGGVIAENLTDESARSILEHALSAAVHFTMDDRVGTATFCEKLLDETEGRLGSEHPRFNPPPPNTDGRANTQTPPILQDWFWRTPYGVRRKSFILAMS